ncbi:MAG TPA: hypothetical protein VIZ65_02235 [Cellvibrionaceae bacterium]
MSNNSWRARAELGNRFFINLLVVMTNLLPRPLLSAALWFIAGYYLLSNHSARAAALHYWSLLQPPAHWFSVWRHFYTFARVSVDRLIMLKKGFAGFDIQFAAEIDFNQLHELNKGAVFLVNHIGNFDVLRHAAKSRGLPRIKIVLDTRQNPQFLRLLTEHNPDIAEDIIDVADGGYALALKLAETVAQGCWIGIMADRIQAQEATTSVIFIGQRAQVPMTPWQIVSILGVPVYGCFGVFCGGNRYRIYLRKIADTLAAARKERQAILHLNVHRYFLEVENILRLHPYNWFNFYEFWSNDGN